MEDAIEKAKKQFGELVQGELDRVERMKKEEDWLDYQTLSPIVVGVMGGDGIGPRITNEAAKIVRYLMAKEEKAGKIEFKNIEGLTIENRAKCLKGLPDDVLAEAKKCHVLLKGPTTTPKKGDGWPNIESAQLGLRRALDLFANVRPVKIPADGIDWTFFRENTEGEYILGSKGMNISDDLAIDFKATTSQGSDRIIRLAFEFAKKNRLQRVTAVTKANVVKTTDGKFLSMAEDIAKEYPEIKFDDWFIDIMAAKLLDVRRRNLFKVVVLPNLYGDIITDEAAQIQGGVGTAGSANIGKRYAMFEAIHGSGLKMLEEGREQYADPTSIVRAAVMLLNHIGFVHKSERLEKAINVCTRFEKKFVCTGRSDGATTEEMGKYIMDVLSAQKDPNDYL